MLTQYFRNKYNNMYLQYPLHFVSTAVSLFVGCRMMGSLCKVKSCI